MRAQSVNKSESPPSITGSACNGGATPHSSHNSADSSAVTKGISGGKVVTPIAALEPKATAGPGAGPCMLCIVGIGGQPIEAVKGLQEWEWMTMSL